MTSNRSTITILVAEDDGLVRLDIAETLRSAGYEVLEASNAENALGCLQTGQRIDGVFTDINLGGDLSGWDVAEKFRAAYSEIPIVYVSGTAGDRHRKVPHSVFLSKPYTSGDVLEACHRWGEI